MSFNKCQQHHVLFISVKGDHHFSCRKAINNAKAIYTGKLWTFHAPRLFHATPLIKKLTVFLAPNLFHAPCLFNTQEYAKWESLKKRNAS